MRAFSRCSVIAAVLIAAALLLVPNLGAQELKYNFTVPFQFYSGDQTMPAGEYQLHFVSSAGCISILKSDLGPASLAPVSRAATTARRGANPNPRIVFHRYGDSYFLRGLKGSSEYEYAWVRSNSEKRAARQANVREIALVPAH